MDILDTYLGYGSMVTLVGQVLSTYAVGVCNYTRYYEMPQGSRDMTLVGLRNYVCNTQCDPPQT